MKINTMRWCDCWLGRPFAFLVWVLAPFLHGRLPVQPGHTIPGVKRIVIIKFFGMGSMLLATPALRSLREAYPEAELDIITHRRHYSFLTLLGLFDNIYGVSLGSFGSFCRDILKILGLPRPDISINLEYFTWFTLTLQTLQRSRVRVGFAERQWLRQRLLDLPVYFNYHYHIKRIFAFVAEQLGAPVNSYALSALPLDEDADREAERILPRAEFDSSAPLISIHIGVSPLCLLRQWPLGRYEELIRMLLTNLSVVIVLIGGNEEKEEADAFAARFEPTPRMVNLVGMLTIPGSLSILKRSRLFITNDSGPLHWAVALDIPTISFFGPETPDLYGPPPRPYHKVFYSRRYCSPCMTTMYAKKSSCRNNLCLQDIPVKEVFNAAVEILDHNNPEM